MFLCLFFTCSQVRLTPEGLHLDFSKMMLCSSLYFVKINVCPSHEKYGTLSAMSFSVRLLLIVGIGLLPRIPRARSWLLMRQAWVELPS